MADVSTYVRGGKAFLRDESGTLSQHDPAKVASRVLSGRYKPVSAEEVAERDQEKVGALGTAAALGEAGAAALFDAATTPVQLAGVALEKAGVYDKNPAAGMSGRKLLENLSFFGGGDKAADQYRQQAQTRAEGAPIASALGSVLGTVAGGLGVAKAAGSVGNALTKATGSKVGGMVVAGGLEGAALGAAAAPEEAYFKDEDLTSEAVIAGMGWGALMGGGAGLALGGAQKLFGRAGTRGSTPVDSPRQAGSSKLEAPLEETAERVLGTAPAPGLGAKLRDAIEGAQSVVTGGERETIGQFGAFRWDSKARRGRSLWRDREKILEGATDEITTHVNSLVEHGRLVTDEVVDTGLKREHIASKLSGDSVAQLAAARAETSKLRAELEAMLPAARTRGAAQSANDVANDFGNDALVGRVHQYVSQIDSAVHSSDDAAAAFIGLDKAKRAMQRWTVSLRDSGRMSTDALKREQSFALGKKLGELQEGTRQLLMQDAVWGKAALDQKAINASWEKFFESKRLFDSHFITRTGSDFERGAVNVADPAKVASYVRRLGRKEAALVDQHFRAHVNAMEELSSAIGGAFDLGPKAEAVAAAKASAKAIRSTLGKADETVSVANQIDALMEAERGGGMSALGGAFGGGMLGGVPGAVLGAAGSIFARPGQMMKQAAALEVLAQNLDTKIGKGVSSFFKRSLEPMKLPQMTTRVPVAGARTVPVVGALELFKGRDADPVKAYRTKVAEIMQANDNYGEMVRTRTQQAMGDIPTQAPMLAGKVVTNATRAAQFLATKITTPLQNAQSFTPRASAPVPSDVEIAKFARYYNTVANPMSALRDLETGTLTSEQAETLKAVYPHLYNRIRLHVIEQLGKADAAGTQLPYHAKVQLDLLLDLKGAGEPTSAPEFMGRFQDMAAQVEQQQAAAGPQKPVKLSSGSASPIDAMRKENL